MSWSFNLGKRYWGQPHEVSSTSPFCIFYVYQLGFSECSDHFASVLGLLLTMLCIVVLMAWLLLLSCISLKQSSQSPKHPCVYERSWKFQKFHNMITKIADARLSSFPNFLNHQAEKCWRLSSLLPSGRWKVFVRLVQNLQKTSHLKKQCLTKSSPSLQNPTSRC